MQIEELFDEIGIIVHSQEQYNKVINILQNEIGKEFKGKCLDNEKFPLIIYPKHNLNISVSTLGLGSLYRARDYKYGIRPIDEFINLLKRSTDQLHKNLENIQEMINKLKIKDDS